MSVERDAELIGRIPLALFKRGGGGVFFGGGDPVHQYLSRSSCVGLTLLLSSARLHARPLRRIVRFFIPIVCQKQQRHCAREIVPSQAANGSTPDGLGQTNGGGLSGGFSVTSRASPGAVDIGPTPTWATAAKHAVAGKPRQAGISSRWASRRDGFDFQSRRGAEKRSGFGGCPVPLSEPRSGGFRDRPEGAGIAGESRSDRHLRVAFFGLPFLAQQER